MKTLKLSTFVKVLGALSAASFSFAFAETGKGAAHTAPATTEIAPASAKINEAQVATPGKIDHSNNLAKKKKKGAHDKTEHKTETHAKGADLKPDAALGTKDATAPAATTMPK